MENNVEVKITAIDENCRLIRFTNSDTDYQVQVDRMVFFGRNFYLVDGYGPYLYDLYVKVMDQVKRDMQYIPLDATVEMAIGKLIMAGRFKTAM